MQVVTGSSLALFALAWALFCLVAGALVTDAMLRHAGRADGVEPSEGRR